MKRLCLLKMDKQDKRDIIEQYKKEQRRRKDKSIKNVLIILFLTSMILFNMIIFAVFFTLQSYLSMVAIYNVLTFASITIVYLIKKKKKKDGDWNREKPKGNNNVLDSVYNYHCIIEINIMNKIGIFNKKWIIIKEKCPKCKSRLRYNIRATIKNGNRYKCRKCNKFFKEEEILWIKKEVLSYGLLLDLFY